MLRACNVNSCCSVEDEKNVIPSEPGLSQAVKKEGLSHTWDTICHDKQSSACAICPFPPTSYERAMTDNRMSCILNGEVIMPGM